jgi:hypothetical protein
MKTTITLTLKINKEAFEDAKRRNGGDIKEVIEEAMSEVFATPVDAIRWSAKHEEKGYSDE